MGICPAEAGVCSTADVIPVHTYQRHVTKKSFNYTIKQQLHGTMTSKTSMCQLVSLSLSVSRFTGVHFNMVCMNVHVLNIL